MMIIEIFNVEHGACALITDDNNRRIMIDCGHNASTGWRPGDHLRSIGVTSLETLVITNYDEDHVSGLCNLFDKVFVQTIKRNTSVPTSEIRRLKTEDGMGPGIDRLIYELDSKFGPPGDASAGEFPKLAGVTEQYWFHTCAQFNDENNLSMIAKITCNGTQFLFTGDMEKAGWEKMLQRTDFTSAISAIDIYIASHHGRLSGYCEDLFKYFSPRFVVVSDKSKSYATQETHHLYAKHTRGGNFDGQPNRSFITTRSDGDLIVIPHGAAFTFSKR